MLPNLCNLSSQRNTLIKLTHNDETKETAHDVNGGMKTDIFLILIRVIDILLYIFRMLWYKVCTGSAFTTRIADFNVFQGESTIKNIVRLGATFRKVSRATKWNVNHKTKTYKTTGY